MKQINFDKLNERNEFSLSNYIGGIEMEFIKSIIQNKKLIWQLG